MFQFDPATGSLVLPIWGSATLAAVIVVIALVAIARAGAIRTLAGLLALAVLGYGGWAGWTIVERIAAGERAAERRAFDQRANELAARALTPGSPLSCLDGMAGEQVEAACERLLFAGADTVASAVSYVATQLDLLAEGLSRGDLSYEPTLATLRKGIETDRYGLVAHVLLRRDNCSVDQCEALALLADPSQVRAHLQDKVFDALVARYAPGWATPTGRPIAEQPKGGPAVAAGPPTVGAPVASKYDFPSSSSIPPVSIMNAEPGTPLAPPASTSASPPPASTSATPPSPSAQAPVPPRRPPAARAPVARAANPSAPPPVQLAPATPASPEPSPRVPAQ